MTLSELIAKLEQASAPDRELDAEIACAARFPEHRPARKGDHAGVHGVDPESDWAGHIYVPTGFLVAYSYTRSIDDAMTLVPEGWNLRIAENDKHWWWAELREGFETSYRRVEIGRSPTPALALCIAALRARAQDKQP